MNRSAGNAVAGVLDAAGAAGSTFLSGLVAVREFSSPSLAAYAVVFSAAVFLMVLPRQLHYTPPQLGANLQPDPVAPHVLASAARSWRVSGLTFAVMTAIGLSLAGTAGLGPAALLGLSAAAYCVVSPLQDHLRASLHIVGRHSGAAAASSVTLVVAGAIAASTLLVRAPGYALLVPFGGLVVANLLSLVVGLALLKRYPRHQDYVLHPFRERAQLVAGEIAVQLAWFGCNYAVLGLLGAATLGRLEAARVVASPVNVVANGVLAFAGPSILRRAAGTDRRGPGPGTVVVILLGGGAVYLLVLALAGPLVSVVLHKPVELGLIAARLLTAVIEGTSGVVVFVLFALGMRRSALTGSVVAGVVGLGATAALAPLLGPFCLPVGQGLGMTLRLLVGGVALHKRPSGNMDDTPRTQRIGVS